MLDQLQSRIQSLQSPNRYQIRRVILDVLGCDKTSDRKHRWVSHGLNRNGKPREFCWKCGSSGVVLEAAA